MEADFGRGQRRRTLRCMIWFGGRCSAVVILRWMACGTAMVLASAGCSSSGTDPQITGAGADPQTSAAGIESSDPRSGVPTDDDPSDLRDLPEVSPEELPDIPRGDLTMDEFCSVWISEANPANLVNELFLPVGSAGDSEEMADEAVSLVQGQHERVLAFTGTVTQIAPDQIRGDVERWSDLETRSSAEYLSRWEDAVRFGGDNPRRSEMLDGDERAEWEDLYMTLNGACGLEPDQ